MLPIIDRGPDFLSLLLPDNDNGSSLGRKRGKVVEPVTVKTISPDDPQKPEKMTQCKVKPEYEEGQEGRGDLKELLKSGVPALRASFLGTLIGGAACAPSPPCRSISVR